MIKLNDWLIDLAENHYVDIIDNEICILPIMEDDTDD